MRYRIPKDTVMTPELLKKYINKHKLDVKERNKPLQDAYENDYEIFHAPQKEDGKPDVRISANFAKYLVDTFTGFFCGIPIKITSDDDKVAEYAELLAAYNDEDNHNLELAKGADIHGDMHELLYVDEDSMICYTEVSVLNSFFLVDDSILERPMYFVRYYEDANNVERGSWSDTASVQYFHESGSYKWDDESVIHGFDGVPAIEYDENKERMGLFESVFSAINAYNKALSEKANDVDYFADAYMKVLGPKVDDDDLPKIRRNRVINFEGDMGSLPEVDFMQKPSADTTQENLLNRLEKDIFLTSMVADVSDENFAGQSSGVALKYKLLAMQDLAYFKQLKFQAALNRRYKLIFSNPLSRGHGVKEDDWTKINYHFTPNYPANVEDEANTAKALDGVVSKETQLKVLSIVDNVQEEIDRMDEESNSAQAGVVEDMFTKENIINDASVDKGGGGGSSNR